MRDNVEFVPPMAIWDQALLAQGWCARCVLVPPPAQPGEPFGPPYLTLHWVCKCGCTRCALLGPLGRFGLLLGEDTQVPGRIAQGTWAPD